MISGWFPHLHNMAAAALISFVSHPNLQVPAKAGFPTISCRMEKANNVNFYKVLSLESEKASAQEIKMAYRSLVRRLHPDVCPPERKEGCTRALVEVNRAYEALSDPALRRNHDAELGLELGGAIRRRGPWQKEIWERQLSELGRRSALRMRRRGRGTAVAW